MEEAKGLLYTDGGARGNPGPAGLGCILFTDTARLLGFDARYAGNLTNNQAEYEALIMGLKLAAKNGIRDLVVYMDSELVIKQMRGEYKVKHEAIIPLQAEAARLAGIFSLVTFIHVERAKNKFADALVNIALDSADNAKA